jgi:hypothetical protein
MYGDTRPTQRHYPRLRHHWCVANADLVEAYWRQYQLSQSQDPVDLAMADSLFHVWEEVEEAAQFGKPEVVDLLVALADAAPNDLALATLGAGPVEDLITSHGEEFVETIDEAARRSESFRKALRCVWYQSSVDESVRVRLQRFGPPL